MSSAKGTIVNGLVVLLMAAGLWHFAKASARSDTDYGEPFAPPPLALLDPSLLKVITLGHKGLYDDFIHIWLLQSLADEHKPEDYPKLKELIDRVVRHRPEIESLYMLSCFVLYKPFGHPEDCQTITLAGLEVFPKSWRLPMMQGFMHAFALDQPAQAATFYAMAASREGSPSYVGELAEKLVKNEPLVMEDVEKSLEIMMKTQQGTMLRDLLTKRFGLNPSER